MTSGMPQNLRIVERVTVGGDKTYQLHKLRYISGMDGMHSTWQCLNTYDTFMEACNALQRMTDSEVKYTRVISEEEIWTGHLQENTPS